MTENPREGAAGRAIRLLIVDDHQMVADSLAQALAEEPTIEVLGVAGTAADGASMALSLNPDVVLMDFGLPDGDGATVTEQIKAVRPDIEVVIFTSTDDDAVVARAIEAGCSGFVTKNKPVRDLIRAIHAAADGEALISPATLARLLPKLRRDHREVGSNLSPREIEILQLFGAGASNDQVGARLGLTINTVRTHVRNVLRKLGAHSKLEAVAIALRTGLIKPP